jgi:probable rRNA maturation factor
MIVRISDDYEIDVSYNYEKRFFDKKFKDFIKNKTILALSELESREGLKLTELSIFFCSDNKIKFFNKHHLNHDHETDIITFEYRENRTKSAELVISAETVKANSKTYNVSFRHEMMRVVIHGLLHVCGYKDKTVLNKRKMKQKENYYLKLLKI